MGSVKVSVVVCTYRERMYEAFIECINSLRNQTYEDIEIVVVVDGTRAVYEQACEAFDDFEEIQIHCNERNRGVSYSRTKGAELASGDVVAFIDDDAVADPRWIEELVKTYEETDAIAVGGRMEGQWIAGKPWYLPEEFYWLVGVTYPDFAEAGEEVRNTFESNISFRRDVFLKLGGYDSDFGPNANSYSHSEGAEIGARLRTRYGRGVVYNPDAVVEHKIFQERIQPLHLLKRAFQQGISKQRLKRQSPTNGNEESTYLRRLFSIGIPRRIRESLRSKSLRPIGKIMMLFVFTMAVIAGYVYEAISGGSKR